MSWFRTNLFRGIQSSKRIYSFSIISAALISTAGWIGINQKTLYSDSKRVPDAPTTTRMVHNFIADAVEKVIDSVVNIAVEQGNFNIRNFRNFKIVSKDDFEIIWIWILY
jgi:hypothetical protein